MRDGKFVGLPLATIGNAIVYRDSWVKAAGFSEFPKTTAEFLELCKALAEDRATLSASRMAMASATATIMPIGCCGAMAERWSMRRASWRSTARKR